MPDPDRRTRLVFSLLRALLGRVPAGLRQVRYVVAADAVTVTFTFAAPPTADEAEELSCGHTECLTDFIDVCPVEFVSRVVPPPADPGDDGEWFFRRFEPPAANSP